MRYYYTDSKELLELLGFKKTFLPALDKETSCMYLKNVLICVCQKTNELFLATPEAYSNPEKVLHDIVMEIFTKERVKIVFDTI